MKTVEVIIENAGTNLSAYIKELPIITVGDTIAEIEANIKDAINLYLEDNANAPELLTGEYTLRFHFDNA